MTNIDRAIAQTERWMDALNIERDLLARETAARRDRFLELRLDQLDRELVDVQALIDHLQKVRLKPALILPERPCRPLKVPLRKRRQMKEAS